MNNRLIVYTLLSVICNHEVFGTETVQQPELQNQSLTVSTCKIKGESAAEAFRTKTMQDFYKHPSYLRVDIAEVKKNFDAFIEVLLFRFEQVDFPRYFRPVVTALESLIFYNSDLTQQLTLDQYKRLAEVLATLNSDLNPNLDNIELNGCGIGDEEAKGVALILENYKNLKSLDLGNNSITFVGASSICDALKSHPSLLRLLMANNNMSDKDELPVRLRGGFKPVLPPLDQAFYDVLTDNKIIRHIDLSDNNISDIYSTASIFHHNSTIVKFNLSGNPITDQKSLVVINSIILDNIEMLITMSKRFNRPISRPEPVPFQIPAKVLATRLRIQLDDLLDVAGHICWML